MGQKFALVASLGIEGGAARSPGSLAIVTHAGHMFGYLSNGCIDRDIILQSVEALQNNNVKQVRYGAGSQYMDIRLPCGGALDILIDPNPDIEILEQAHQALNDRRNAQLNFSIEAGLVHLSTESRKTKQFVYSPKPTLLLVGRGAILLTTAKLAMQMDFEIHIATPDEDDLAILSQFKPAVLHRMTNPRAAFDMQINAHTAVILLFHDHEWEQSILMSCAQQEPFFLGAMGSRKTHERRIADLISSGLSKRDCSKIRGPIGLVPSLRNASLIAVSALAEVTAALPVSQYES